MKTNLYIFCLALISTLILNSCKNQKTKEIIKPKNYTIILDLSDRILVPEQIDKDIYLIEKYFKIFEENSRRNLVLTSKNRFTVKIIPQKNSPLHWEHYEDLLQLYLDEIKVEDKNKALTALSSNLPTILESIKKAALYSNHSTDYFGVDIWAYLNNNGRQLSKTGYQNTFLVLTDGYFDFEKQTHVVKKKNQYTSTQFLNELTSSDWKKISESKSYGLLPIQLDKNSKWIVAGIAGKKDDDILQTEKISFFWKKWMKQSGVSDIHIILNASKTTMSSSLVDQLY